MAINLYLARRYGADAGLWPKTIEGEALAWQWSFWVMTEVEHALLTVLLHTRSLPKSERDPDRVRRNLEALTAPFQVLDQALAGKEYLIGAEFSVADLNVASVFVWCKPARVPLQDYPSLDAWLSRCLARPARKQAQLA